MELLASLEKGPRGVYTGAVGHVPPDGLARFNVAIRTAVVDRLRGTLSFGIGSGIVWDSEAGAEYAECLLEGSVLGRSRLFSNCSRRCGGGRDCHAGRPAAGDTPLAD